MENSFLNESTIAQLLDYAVKIGGALVLLLAAWIASAWFGSLVKRKCEQASIEVTLAKFFGSVAKYLILASAVLASLGVFGVETTSFAAILGAAGLAVGLAFQGSLSNFACGVMLLTFRPFKVGDVATAGGQTGKVDEIGLFTTTLITPDNRKLIVPNSAIFGATIENVTAFDTRRVDVAVGVDYTADIDSTRRVLEKAITQVKGLLPEPGHAVVLTGLGASSVDWSVRVWSKTEDYWGVKEDLTAAIKYALDDERIGIPYPQMDVHLDTALLKALQGISPMGGTSAPKLQPRA